MTRKGVLVSVNSDSAELARRLNTEAAKSMKWGGLTEDEALALVTINPAKQLRIDARVGSLEVGKDADVVVWNHHPLSSYAIADRVYIDGTLYYDRIAEDKRLTDLDREKADLVAAEKRHPRPSTGAEQRDVGDTPPPQPDLQNAITHAGANGRRPAPCGRSRTPPFIPISRPRHRARHDRDSRLEIEAVGANVQVPAGATDDRWQRARTSIRASSTPARRWGSTSPARAASRTSTRCSTTTRSCARGWRITSRATRFRSRARTALRPSRSCHPAGFSAARSRS